MVCVIRDRQWAACDQRPVIGDWKRETCGSWQKEGVSVGSGWWSVIGGEKGVADGSGRQSVIGSGNGVASGEHRRVGRRTQPGLPPPSVGPEAHTPARRTPPWMGSSVVGTSPQPSTRRQTSRCL
eukprot:341621-Chlamydomonas_euryale.AAC.4